MHLYFTWFTWKREHISMKRKVFQMVTYKLCSYCTCLQFRQKANLCDPWKWTRWIDTELIIQLHPVKARQNRLYNQWDIHKQTKHQLINRTHTHYLLFVLCSVFRVYQFYQSTLSKRIWVTAVVASNPNDPSICGSRMPVVYWNLLAYLCLAQEYQE